MNIEYDDAYIKDGNIMVPKHFDIFFSDLNENVQNDLLKSIHVKNPKDMNWDMDIVPIVSFNMEVEIDDD